MPLSEQLRLYTGIAGRSVASNDGRCSPDDAAEVIAAAAVRGSSRADLSTAGLVRLLPVVVDLQRRMGPAWRLTVFENKRLVDVSQNALAVHISSEAKPSSEPS